MRHSCIAANYPSFDHLVGTGKKRGRHDEAERLSGLEVDSKHKGRCLLHRQLGGLGSLDDLMDVKSTAPERSVHIRTVAQKAARFRELSKSRYARQMMSERKDSQANAIVEADR